MKYWLILTKDKAGKLTCFSESPIVSWRRRILGVWFFLMPLYIAYYAVGIIFKKKTKKFNRSEVFVCSGVGEMLHRSSSFSYHASKTLISIESSDLRDLADGRSHVFFKFKISLL